MRGGQAPRLAALRYPRSTDRAIVITTACIRSISKGTTVRYSTLELSSYSMLHDGNARAVPGSQAASLSTQQGTDSHRLRLLSPWHHAASHSRASSGAWKGMHAKSKIAFCASCEAMRNHARPCARRGRSRSSRSRGGHTADSRLCGLPSLDPFALVYNTHPYNPSPHG